MQRVLLVTSESGWLEEIAKEYEGMHILIDAGATDSLLQQLQPVRPGIYFIDPLGNAIAISVPVPSQRFASRQTLVAERLVATKNALEAHMNSPAA